MYLACGDGGDRLVNITWESWTNDGATGTAARETQDRPGGEIERTENVSVEMQNPTATADGIAFQQVKIGDEEIVHASVPVR